MGFLQIITFATDRLEEFVAREHEWSESTTGRAHRRRRAGLRRPRPTGSLRRPRLVRLLRVRHGQLGPARDRRLRPAGRGAGQRGPDVPRPRARDGRRGAPGRTACARPWRPRPSCAHTFADDVDLDILVPHGRMRFTGVAAARGRRCAPRHPARDIERWHVAADAPTASSVEYAYRTHGRPSPAVLAAGIMLVTRQRRARSSRLAITCAGNWSAETEASVVEETGALGPRAHLRSVR